MPLSEAIAQAQADAHTHAGAVAVGLAIWLVALVALQLLNRRLHPRMAGPGWWALGTVASGAGLALLAGREGLSSVAGPGLFLGGQALVLVGLRAFADTPASGRLPALVVLAAVTGLAGFTYAAPSAAARAGVLLAADALLALATLRALAAASRRDGGLAGVAFGVARVGQTLILLAMALAIAASEGVLAMPGSPGISGLAGTTGLLSLLALQALQNGGLLLLCAGRSQRELADLALVDGVTGLSNRRAFDTALARAVGAARRARTPLGLVLIDIDQFGAIVQAHGPQQSDAVLREVARRLSDSVRTSDLPARVGPERFAALLCEPLPTSVREVAERARLAVCRRPIETGGQRLQVTVSVGVALAAAVGGPARDDLYLRADHALQRARESGRDRVVLSGDV